MPNVLVTGGAGFIGSHVVDELIKLGCKVVVLDDLSGGRLTHVNPRAGVAKGSIVSPDLVDNLFAHHRFDYVYHCAAYAAEGLSHFIKRFNYQQNLVGSINLINASVNHGVKSFVFTSSIAVYGNGQVPMREDVTPTPEDSYGIAKYAVELELAATHRMFGLEYVIFRPHNVYGERQNMEDTYRNVVGIFMNRVLRGLPLPIFGDGEQERAFTYVGDIASAIAQAPLLPAARQQVFNIGSDVHVTVNELAELVCEAMGVPLLKERLAARDEVKIAYADHRRFQEVFPQWRSTPLESGLERMARWARVAGVPPHQTAAFDGIEIHKNLPAAWVRGGVDESRIRDGERISVSG